MQSKWRETAMLVFMVIIVVELMIIIGKTDNITTDVRFIKSDLIDNTDSMPPWPTISADGVFEGPMPMASPNLSTHRQLEFLTCQDMTYQEMNVTLLRKLLEAHQSQSKK